VQRKAHARNPLLSLKVGRISRPTVVLSAALGGPRLAWGQNKVDPVEGWLSPKDLCPDLRRRAYASVLPSELALARASIRAFEEALCVGMVSVLAHASQDKDQPAINPLN